MGTAHPSRFRSLALVCFASLAALCLGGCVYLRLLELKTQLGDFNKNFGLRSDDGVTIDFLHPILVGDDLRWLGAEPKTITPLPGGEQWHIRWLKEPPPGAAESVVHDVELSTRFVKERLVSVQIPERFFAYFSKDLFLTLLRSASSAKIDRSERKAEVKTETRDAVSSPLPGLSNIEAMLGLPTERQNTEAAVIYMYRYRPDAAGTDLKAIEVTFNFNPLTGQLQKLIGKLPRGTMQFDLSDTEATDKKKRERARRER